MFFYKVWRYGTLSFFQRITSEKFLPYHLAEGPYFQGMILPGGVDTQKIYPDGSGVLNARYMLEGKDSEGKECRIFIDNTAELGSNETVPRIVTDSAILQKFAEKELAGEMEMKEDRLIIEIFEK